MSPSSSVTLRWADRRSLRAVSSVNHRLTRLSQDELAVRSRAWICDFSSTARTRACSGVHIQADDIADLRDELRIRAQLPGLHDVGFRPKARQIRDTDDCDSPVSSAIDRLSAGELMPLATDVTCSG